MTRSMPGPAARGDVPGPVLHHPRRGSRRRPGQRDQPRITLADSKPEPPGSKHAALADFLRGHTDGGALMRRLHPIADPED
jgi:hypothetical protein